jgi:hypothetical protein
MKIYLLITSPLLMDIKAIHVLSHLYPFYGNAGEDAGHIFRGEV